MLRKPHVALCVILAAAGVTLTAYGIWRPRPPVGARVEVDQDTHNFGKVSPGSDVVATFAIRNAGGSTLKLGKPKASCGCLETTVSPKDVPAGRASNVTVKVHVPDRPGAGRESVRIPTNDPRRPALELFLFSEAWTGVRTEPRSVDFGAKRPGEEAEQVIQVYSPDSTPLALYHVDCDMPGLSVVRETAETPLRAHRLRVRYRGGSRLGLQEGRLRFITDRVDTSTLEVPVTCQMLGDVALHPSRLTIDLSEIGTPVRRTFMVQPTRGDRRPSLRSLEVVPPWRKHDVQTRPFGERGLAVEVAIEFPTGSGDSSGELLVKLVEPDSTCRVPLVIRGRTPTNPER